VPWLGTTRRGICCAAGVRIWPDSEVAELILFSGFGGTPELGLGAGRDLGASGDRTAERSDATLHGLQGLIEICSAFDDRPPPPDLSLLTKCRAQSCGPPEAGGLG
jgi:hypothetical protein